MIPAIRGQCARLAFIVVLRIVVLRTVAATPAERASKSILYAAVIMSVWAVAYLWWLVSGRGPWRWLGLSSAPVAPRRLPGGAFWRARAERFPSPPDVA
jgi:hypothetical protein